jgi:hypothetical protein
MKKVIFLLTLICCGSSLSAQSTLDTLRFADLKWSLQKKAVVLNYMNFTEGEKASFWPVFDSYNNATRFIELESLMLLKKFSDANGDFSTQELEEISRRMLHNDVQLAKLRKQFYKRFKDAVSSKQATAFFQIDTMFRSMMRLEAQRYFASSQMMELARNNRN